MSTGTIAAIKGEGTTAEQRWDAWVARGVANHLKHKKQAVVVLVVLVALLAIALFLIR